MSPRQPDYNMRPAMGPASAWEPREQRPARSWDGLTLLLVAMTLGTLLGTGIKTRQMHREILAACRVLEAGDIQKAERDTTR